MFGYACDRCREKHQSCNHEHPCKRCIKANVGDLCHYTPKRSRTKGGSMPHGLGGQFLPGMTLINAATHPAIASSSFSPSSSSNIGNTNNPNTPAENGHHSINIGGLMHRNPIDNSSPYNYPTSCPTTLQNGYYMHPFSASMNGESSQYAGVPNYGHSAPYFYQQGTNVSQRQAFDRPYSPPKKSNIQEHEFILDKNSINLSRMNETPTFLYPGSSSSPSSAYSSSASTPVSMPSSPQIPVLYQLVDPLSGKVYFSSFPPIFPNASGVDTRPITPNVPVYYPKPFYDTPSFNQTNAHPQNFQPHSNHPNVAFAGKSASACTSPFSSYSSNIKRSQSIPSLPISRSKSIEEVNTGHPHFYTNIYPVNNFSSSTHPIRPFYKRDDTTIKDSLDKKRTNNIATAEKKIGPFDEYPQPDSFLLSGIHFAVSQEYSSLSSHAKEVDINPGASSYPHPSSEILDNSSGLMATGMLVQEYIRDSLSLLPSNDSLHKYDDIQDLTYEEAVDDHDNDNNPGELAGISSSSSPAISTWLSSSNNRSNIASDFEKFCTSSNTPLSGFDNFSNGSNISRNDFASS